MTSRTPADGLNRATQVGHIRRPGVTVVGQPRVRELTRLTGYQFVEDGGKMLLPGNKPGITPVRRGIS